MAFWDDILSQEANLRTVIDRQASDGRDALKQAAAMLKQTGRVTYSGVGSGLNACLPPMYYFMARGFPAQAIDATEAAYGMLPGLRDSALILNTRSGETVEVVKLGQQAREAGIPLITVTNEPDSQAGRLADVCLPTYSRWDELVVLSAYAGMMAPELILAAMVTGDEQAMLADLRRAADAVGDMLAQATARREEMADLFAGDAPIYLMGRGPSLASAWGGGLAIQETSRRHTVSMPTGLFRQGPIEVVDASFRAVIFEGAGDTVNLSYQLAQALLAQGASLLWLGRRELSGAVNLALPDLPAHILPLVEIVPCHVLAYDLATRAGIVPGEVRHIQQVITTEIGLPNAGEG